MRKDSVTAPVVHTGAGPQVGGGAPLACEREDRKQPLQLACGMLTEKVSTDCPPIDIAGRFLDVFRSYLDKTPRGELGLWRLSLTMPRWEPSLGRLAQAAETLATSIAAEPGGGALLALDRTEAGRPHLYAIALSGRERGWFIQTWIELSGATRKGNRAQLITGQRDGWGSDPAAAAKLAPNLARVVRYALKTLPAGFKMDPERRVIAMGSLRSLWQAATAFERSAQVDASHGSSATQPLCQHCRCPIEPQKRKHALWCSPSCRTLAWRERRNLLDQLSAAEREEFAERASLMTTSCGRTSPRSCARGWGWVASTTLP